MFNWLKTRMTEAAANQCKYNIKLNAQRVAWAANEAFANIEESNTTNEADKNKVVSCQNDLLTDVQLGIANELTIDDIKNVIDNAVKEIELTEGARMALDHVLDSVKT